METTANTEVEVSKTIPLQYKKIKELRDSQEMSFSKIASELGANLQSVQACYEAGEDRMYRPRGKRAKNGNGKHKAALKVANGNKSAAPTPKNGAAGKPAKSSKPSLKELTDRFIGELRARGVSSLKIDVVSGDVALRQENETSWRARRA